MSCSKYYIVGTTASPCRITILSVSNYVGDEIKEGDIRLVGGRYTWEGRVEIFLHGVWGTVSDDLTSKTDASIVCRQLGYNTFSKAHFESNF